MPVHDWARVDPNLFHHFHQAWTMTITHRLNGGLLPKGFSALVEQHAAGVVPDVIALQRKRKPKPSEEPKGGNVIIATPPKTSFIIRSEEEISAKRGNRITIRHPLGRIVCVIEIVSPGNKSSRSALRAFVEKDGRVFLAEDLLDALLVVETADPDFRAVGQRKVALGLVLLEGRAGMAEPENLGQRIEGNRSARGIAAQAQNGMAGFVDANGALGDRANEQRGLAGTRAANEQRMPPRRQQQLRRLLLSGCEFELCYGRLRLFSRAVHSLPCG